MGKSARSSSAPDATASRPRGRPREFNREAALGKAMRLFWIKGYEATSIADLTAVTGVGTKSLYAAFNSKDALYGEALNLYLNSFESLVWSRFRAAATARGAASVLLQDSAIAMTGAGSDLPQGCMATLAFVGGDDHAELGEMMRSTRSKGFDLLKARFDRAMRDGDLPPNADTTKLARFVQTVQSGMAIRARDGGDRAELEAVAETAMTGWDGAGTASRQSPTAD